MSRAIPVLKWRLLPTDPRKSYAMIDDGMYLITPTGGDEYQLTLALFNQAREVLGTYPTHDEAVYAAHTHAGDA